MRTISFKHRYNLIHYAVLLMLILWLSACSPQSEQSQITDVMLAGKTMGTTYHIKLVASEQRVSELRLAAAIDDLLVEVNQQMSTYITTSELSLFNQSSSGQAITISEGLRTVVAESIRLGQLSDGLLDVTVGPLVNLWGFGPKHRPDVVPTDEQLADARKRVGLDKLKLVGHQLQKLVPDLYVDLSTTAKGYGVDVIADFLEQQGFSNYLVEIGGEMRVRGHKAKGELWRVAIEKPESEHRAVQQIITPKNNAIATSGDYRIYFEANGQRFSHIINPHTGKPINHRLVSVTVIDKSCMTADGLATMLMVMGTEQALAFAQQHDLAVLLISKTNDGFEQQSTVKFQQYLVQ